jgi:cyclic pyranopterin monophosphate synthase
MGRRTARRPRCSNAVTAQRLTHVDATGRARMVDISDKAVTQRSATARGRVSCSAETVQRIADDTITKGSVLDTARLAGIMGAKRTSDLIPLCHPLGLRHVDVDLRLDTSATPGIVIEATARVEGATGVEMEALTAVAIAGLTVIDMIKAVDHWASITEVALVHKEGGRSGSLDRPEDA